MNAAIRSVLLAVLCAWPAGCAPTVAVVAVTPPAGTPTIDAAALGDEALLRRRLSAWEPGACADLEAGVTDPVRGLLAVIEHTPRGPAPVVAARCLVTRHLDDARPAIEGWLVSPSHKGLALVALRGLDAIPEDDATALGRLALAGPLADTARGVLARSASPAVRTLALEVTP